MSKAFNLIFTGKLLPGTDAAKARKKLALAMKIDDARVEQYFKRAPFVLKKNIDAATASRFEKALATTGFGCRIEPVGSGGAVAAETPQPPPSRPDIRATTIYNADGGKMIITNMESVPGKTIVAHYGLVSGSTIRAKHVGRDIMAGLKNIVGGELKGYTQLLQESRKQATDRMVEHAKTLGANAIVNVRFSTSSVAQGAAELYAYGTAVTVQ
jgi:uncharacterized protein YbjQ (UPF0145 family)